MGLIPGAGRSLRAGNGNPLQYSCLENPTDRGAWRDTVYRVACSQTRLKPRSLGGRTLRAPCALGEASVTQGVCRGALGKVSYERMPEGRQRRGASARGKGVRQGDRHRDTCRTSRCLREPAALPRSRSELGHVQWGRGRGKGCPVAQLCLTLRDPVDCDSLPWWLRR